MRRFSWQYGGSLHTKRTRLGNLPETQIGIPASLGEAKGTYVNEPFLRRNNAEQWAQLEGRLTIRSSRERAFRRPAGGALCKFCVPASQTATAVGPRNLR